MSDSDNNWEKEIKNVKPLKGRKKHLSQDVKYKRPKAVEHDDFYAKMLRKESHQLPLSENITAENPKILDSPHIDRNTRKRIDSGKMRIDGILDLHDMNREQAFETLIRFVQQSYSSGLRLLLIITGKGNKQEDSGVLRKLFPDWLETPHLKPFIVRASQASKQHGGSGAWYIYLKRN
jgi:DNA-nicking Smr family endonuclease